MNHKVPSLNNLFGVVVKYVPNNVSNQNWRQMLIVLKSFYFEYWNIYIYTIFRYILPFLTV